MKILIFLILGVFFSTTVSFMVNIPWLMPIFNPVVPYPIFLLKVHNQKYQSAFFWMLL